MKKTCNDSLALLKQSKHYPERYKGRVPKRVKMLKTVREHAFPEGCGTLHALWELQYDVQVNIHGAVSAILSDNRLLGLKPDEFKVIEWHSQNRQQNGNT